jgi:galactokinase
MRQGDLSRVGELMKGSHRGLRDDYEVSCRELDLLSTLADEEPTILGSRMMGGGFGGCTINLVQENGLDQLLFRIKQAYQEATGIVLKHYSVVTDDGASKS